MRLTTLRPSFLGLGIGLLALAVPVAAGAHHSFNMFALDKIVTVSGTVKDYQFKMPHVWVYMLVPGATGEAAQDWGFEAHAPNMVANALPRRISYRHRMPGTSPLAMRICRIPRSDKRSYFRQPSLSRLGEGRRVRS